MKRAYEKPMISVEELQLDSPVALGCTILDEDLKSLIELDYFGGTMDCLLEIPEGGQLPGTHDTVCYHSNVTVMFAS